MVAPGVTDSALLYALKNSFQLNVYVTPQCFTECSGHLVTSLPYVLQSAVVTLSPASGY